MVIVHIKFVIFSYFLNIQRKKYQFLYQNIDIATYFFYNYSKQGGMEWKIKRVIT